VHLYVSIIILICIVICIDLYVLCCLHCKHLYCRDVHLFICIMLCTIFIYNKHIRIFILNFILYSLLSYNRPCINHVPSMKQFRLVQPEDAEVLRDKKYIRYDHTSLVVGDIVRLVEGDIVPADCILISLGMDHLDATTIVDEESNTASSIDIDSNGMMDITVDSHLITGEIKPRQISNQSKGTVNNLTTLYYGSRILEGACIAVVTATGSRVVLAKLIREGRFPPSTDLTDEVHEINRMENEEGISLTSLS